MTKILFMDNKEIFDEISLLIKKYFKNKPNSQSISIPLASPSYGPDEVIEAVDSLLSTWVTMGNKVKKFEEMFSNYIGTKYSVMVNSGSSANLLAFAVLTNPLLKTNFKTGDEIITPALTWSTTVYPMVNLGLKPVFVDVFRDSLTIDFKKIQNAITEKTKAIMPVHLLGNPAHMNEIMDIAKSNNLLVIEDACEAHGAEENGKKVGSFGDISTFSFFMSHHITTIEGGILLTNNEEYYEIAKALRAFGWIRDLKNKHEISQSYPNIDSRFLFTNLGFNIRPTEIQGSFGIHQLPKLEHFIQLREENVKFWNNFFKQFSDYFDVPIQRSNTRHTSFGYSIILKENSPFSSIQLSKFLESKNIESRPIMAGNITRQPSSSLFDYDISGSLVNSDYIMNNGLFLPNHQNVGKREREYLSECILDFITNKRWQ
jgi:CDP-4-dehydro-6-deoxyglucose reductase, E1